MGNKLKYAREKHGLSQEELANRSGVCRATISAIENDDGGKNVTVGTLLKLATALETNVEDIFFDKSV